MIPKDMEKKDDIIEENGIVVYDESDDYDPGQDEINDNEFHLMTNEEIFTDEYMRDYSERMDAKIARNRHNDRLISVGVIIAVIVFILSVIFLNFRNIL